MRACSGPCYSFRTPLSMGSNLNLMAYSVQGGPNVSASSHHRGAGHSMDVDLQKRNIAGVNSRVNSILLNQSGCSKSTRCANAWVIFTRIFQPLLLLFLGNGENKNARSICNEVWLCARVPLHGTARPLAWRSQPELPEEPYYFRTKAGGEQPQCHEA